MKSSPRLGIVDYGLGNLASVAGAVERLGCEPLISGKSQALSSADALILPGVGAFGDGIKNIRQRNLVETLEKLVLGDLKPILCICLGFQLLATNGSEFGEHRGLGWIDATIERIRPDPPSLRVPHVGWDELHQVRDCALFEGIPQDSLFYYVHSYAMVSADGDQIVGECDYGGPFIAAICKENIFGVQFHPEKSQRHGLRLLRNFVQQI